MFQTFHNVYVRFLYFCRSFPGKLLMGNFKLWIFRYQKQICCISVVSVIKANKINRLLSSANQIGGWVATQLRLNFPSHLDEHFKFSWICRLINFKINGKLFDSIEYRKHFRFTHFPTVTIINSMNIQVYSAFIQHLSHYSQTILISTRSKAPKSITDILSICIKSFWAS